MPPNICLPVAAQPRREWALSPMQHLQQEYYMYEVIVVWSCELLQQLSNVMIAGESSATLPPCSWLDSSQQPRDHQARDQPIERHRFNSNQETQRELEYQNCDHGQVQSADLTVRNVLDSFQHVDVKMHVIHLCFCCFNFLKAKQFNCAYVLFWDAFIFFSFSSLGSNEMKLPVSYDSADYHVISFDKIL